MILADAGIACQPKYIVEGSLKGTWRLYNHDIPWWDNTELQNKLKCLGFRNHDGEQITNFNGNGGIFSVFLIAPYNITNTCANGSPELFASLLKTLKQS